MAHRGYSWNKSDLKTAYTPCSSSSSKSQDSISSTKKYDNTYTRSKTDAPLNKETTRTLPTLDKIGTSRYTTTTNYKTSYTPVSSTYSRDKSSTRDKDGSTAGTRYGSYSTDDKSDKSSVLNKYMNGRASEKSCDASSSTYNNRLSVNTSIRSHSRDPSPADKNRYGYSRTLSNSQPATLDTTGRVKSLTETKEKANDSNTCESKSLKTPSYNTSYSSYKLYSRPLSYNRTILKEENKVEPSNTSRYSTNRFGTSFTTRLSSPFVSSSTTSQSPSTVNDHSKSPMQQVECINEVPKLNCETKTEIPENREGNDSEEDEETTDSEDESSDNSEESMVNVTVVTRGTSPTPPSSSVYLRTRRADMAKTIEKTITKSKKKIKMVDKEMQSDRLDDSTRSSRYGITARVSSPWSSYLDTRYTGSTTSSRYSSGRYYNYSSSRETLSNDRTSRISESEVETKAPASLKTIDDSVTNNSQNGISKSPVKEIPSLRTISPIKTPTKNESPPENVAKERLKSPTPPKSIVETKLTLENSDQLPPQVPKSDTASLTKSSTSTHSLNKGLKSTGKKIVKKIKSKNGTVKEKKTLRRSVSSSSSGDSESIQSNISESSVEKENAEILKSLTKTKSKSSLLKSKSTSNGPVKNDNIANISKCTRSSSSPESSLTTPSSDSSSEEEKKVKNRIDQKTQDMSSRTSADEISLSYDSSSKPPPSPKNHKSDSQPRTEEAKSFLMRALAPVASLFKMNSYQDSDKSQWLESNRDSDNQNTYSNIPSLSSNSENCKQNTRTDSSSKDWWLDSKSDFHNLSISNGHDNQSKEVNNNGFKFKLTKQESGEKAWWLQSNANIPDGVEILPPSRKGSTDSEKSEHSNVHKIQSEDKEKWNESNSTSDRSKVNGDDNFILNVVKIRHIESGEKAWWLCSNKNIPEGVHYSSASSSDDSSDYEKNDLDEGIAPGETVVTGKYSVPLVLSRDDDDYEPLGDRKSPEGLETPQTGEMVIRRIVPYNTIGYKQIPNRVVKHNDYIQKNLPDYISRHVDIDDVLGTSGHLFSPMMDRLLAKRICQDSADGDSSECEEIDPTQVRIHDSTAQMPVIQKVCSRSSIIDCSNECEPYEQLSVDDKHATELRMTRHELTCRVRYVNDTDPFKCWSDAPIPGKSVLHTFSTIFPLTCQLPTIHRLLEAPQRLDDSALQVYKDGDYGPYLDLQLSLNEHKEEFEGFFNNRKNCLVLRTQLSVRVNSITEKLLNSEGRELRRALYSLKQIFQEDKDLVHEFVQNGGLDCLIRVGAGAAVGIDQNYQNYILRALGQVMLYVDGMNGVMKHLPSLQWLYTLIASDYRLVIKTALKLLLVFVEYVDTNCILLINAINTVDTDRESPPWSNIINLLKDYEASDTELLIYAMTLVNKCLSGIIDHETYHLHTDSLKEQGIYDVIQRYISYENIDLDLKHQLQIYKASTRHKIVEDKNKWQFDETLHKRSEDDAKLNRSKGYPLNLVNGESSFTSPQKFGDSSEKSKVNSTLIRSASDVLRENITASLQRRRERMKRQRELIKEQQELSTLVTKKLSKTPEESNIIIEESMMDNHVSFVKKQNTVKDIAGMLSNQTTVKPLTEDNLNRVGDMAGIISKAIKGLSNCQIKESRSPNDMKAEVKRTNDIEWLNIAKALNRPLIFNSYDFSDLTEDEDDELPSVIEENVNPPPPPPPFLMSLPNIHIPPPPMCPVAPVVPDMIQPLSKTKKTIKLFWREIPSGTKLPSDTIWDELNKVKVDEASLEMLFETRTKEITKKQLEASKNREIIVLDHKRSNAINILLKKLPPTQSIKNAIVNMDSTVLTREGIDKLLAMLPSKDEIKKIQEAQVGNPSAPLGKAEQFLMTLSSIYELNARLKLWAFRLDFECFQNEILEAYIDMKQAIEILKVNPTFKKILACILSIGVFLNGTEAKGFQIEYLSKIQEVKDTVHKHSLLHHICEMVLDQFPDTSDLYSEIGAVTRSSKINYEELSSNIDRLETECKNHMGNFKVILKHDVTTIKTKVGDFLHDCAERIMILGLIKRRLFYRFSKFLIWLGIPPHHISETRPSDLFKTISEFALEYRTTRQQLQQQRQRKATHRERSRTRGKMITELNQLHLNKSAENELTNILNTENFSKTSSNALGRKRKDPEFKRFEKLNRSDNQENGIEEIFDILLEKSRTRKSERSSKNLQKLQNTTIKRSRTREVIPIELGLQSTQSLNK